MSTIVHDLAPWLGDLLSLCALVFSWLCGVPVTVRERSGAPSETALVLHGGAGSIRPDEMDETRAEAYRTALRTALQEGNEVLQDGGSALNAVQAAVTTMETSALFNAGRGAVLTREDTVELEAALVDGATRGAGALTGVKTVKHPIRLARTIMEASDHVMLAGEEAETFARQHGLEMVENDHFVLESRRSDAADDESTAEASPEDIQRFGTVGAVALDATGTLAAGTSTGGISNKRPGRVGDSPLIGAGTYASNASCAVSATGQGEFFIRGVAAHSIASRVRFGGWPPPEAAQATLEEIEELGGVGGVVVLDREGNMAMTFSTAGMFRACVTTDGDTAVRLFGPENEA